MEDDSRWREWPYDLFELVSDRLHPESVGAFAATCRAACAAVSRAGFWRRLHADLWLAASAADREAAPQELRPWNVARRGVRVKWVPKLLQIPSKYTKTTLRSNNLHIMIFCSIGFKRLICAPSSSA